MARCGGLRGAGGISTAAKMAANIERGFCPKNRSAAVVPSARARKKLWIAVRHSRFRGRVIDVDDNFPDKSASMGEHRTYTPLKTRDLSSVSCPKMLLLGRVCFSSRALTIALLS